MADPSPPYRIVVVDDHSLFRSGLINLIRDMASFQIAGQAGDGREALNVIRDTEPDLVLVDVNMPEMNGIQLVKSVRETNPSIRLVMLTISKQEEDLMGAIQAGADGYILKNAEPEDLEEALRGVMADQSVLSPDVTGTVFKVMRNVGKKELDDPLTEREKDVLKCLAQGLTTAESAEKLVISKNTVKTHVRNILDKLDVANRAEAVSVALKRGLIG